VGENGDARAEIALHSYQIMIGYVLKIFGSMLDWVSGRFD